MDISSASSVAAAVTQASQAKTGSAVEIAVLKKSLDMQSQNAAQMIAALPQPNAGGPVGALGNNVNTFA